MWKNKGETFKTIIYLVYIYIFSTKCIDVIKMLKNVLKNSEKSKLNKMFTFVSLFIILLQFLYLYVAESKRLIKLYKYFKANCYEICVISKNR